MAEGKHELALKMTHTRLDLSGFKPDVDEIDERLPIYEKAEAEGKLNDIDKAILAGYRAAKNGVNQISLIDAVGRGGRRAKSGLPYLAVAKATDTEVWVRADPEGSVRYASSQNGVLVDSRVGLSGVNLATKASITLPPETLTVERTNSEEYYAAGGNGLWERVYGSAAVPHVPLHLRPSNLGEYVLLWEAKWARRPDPDAVKEAKKEERRRKREEFQNRLAASVDPALLKHIGGFLYEVVAVWELTEIERHALSS